MAAWGGYPQTVNYSTVNIAKGGGSENLLINPRGKINQLGEVQGVVAAGQYFCDGWKAGAAGAEVYVDEDGFRLISGSIVQLVPNIVEAGRNLRSNMDVISGAPVMSINGGTSSEPNGAGDYIQFEVSGDNSKFTRIIMAESVDIPIYQQAEDELTPCLKFLYIEDFTKDSSAAYIGVTNFYQSGNHWGMLNYPTLMNSIPAVSAVLSSGVPNVVSTKSRVLVNSVDLKPIQKITADARP